VGLDLVIDFLREKISPNNTIPVNLAPDKLYVEAVERVHKQILRRDAEQYDFLKCVGVNDLVLGRGQVTPENTVLTGQKGFSYGLVRTT
jgi:hypothetical protein